MPHISQLPAGQKIGNVSGDLEIDSVGNLILNPTGGTINASSKNISSVNILSSTTVNSVNGNFLTATGSDPALAIGKATFAKASVLFTGDGTSYYSDSNNPADVAFFRSAIGTLRISDATLLGSATLQINNIASFGSQNLTISSSANINFSSLNARSVLSLDASKNLVSTQLTNGQLMIGNSGNVPAAATLTAGSGISITNGSGSITIAATSAGFTWTTVTGTSQTISAENGYISNNAALITFTLPSTASVGDTFQIVGLGSGGWKIAQNASQLIHFGSSVTTTGTGGSLASTNQYDVLTVVCTVANTTFSVTTAIGNLTVV